MKLYIADPRNRQTKRYIDVVAEMRAAAAEARERAEAGRRRMRKIVERMRFNRLTSILAVLLLSCAGCETLTRFQANPTVQFIEMQAIKMAQTFFNNGGETDAAWGISAGLNMIGDVATFVRQQKQAKDAAEANALAGAALKKTVREFAGDPTAVRGLSEQIAGVIAHSNATTPEQRAKITLAIAAGIQKAAASETP